ncbi:DUF120 domain-containing protein [Stetteria hydrogenophila]
MGKIRVEGTVFSGRGEGGFYVSIYARSFRRALGFTPYPGTLNVKIDRGGDALRNCLSRGGVLVEPPRIAGERLARVRVYPARIEGIPAYVVRPDVTVYGYDVIELISEAYLRGLLNLSDGDRVEVEVDCG